MDLESRRYELSCHHRLNPLRHLKSKDDFQHRTTRRGSVNDDQHLQRWERTSPVALTFFGNSCFPLILRNIVTAGKFKRPTRTLFRPRCGIPMIIFLMFTETTGRRHGLTGREQGQTLSRLMKNEIEKSHCWFSSFATISFQGGKFHLKKLIKCLEKNKSFHCHRDH